MLYFIVNKKSRSGKGAEIWSEVQTALDARHIRYQAYTTEIGRASCRERVSFFV